MTMIYLCELFFFFQAEDGIRDLVRSRGLGDVYKRQVYVYARDTVSVGRQVHARMYAPTLGIPEDPATGLSLIHI